MRLGVIGHGQRVSGLINDCFRAIAPDLSVVAIVDPDEKGAHARLPEADRAAARFYADLDDMVRREHLDALVIGTRCNLHTPYAIQAAHYDLPLFLEKPVATSMQQALALEDAFANARCMVMVSFPLKLSPLCELARQRIQEGAVGNPLHILGVNYVPYGTVYFDAFYRDYSVTQGLFLQKATHDFDYMSYLMGSSIVRVAAMQTRGRVFGGDKPAGLHCSDCPEQGECLESPQNRRRNGSGGFLNDHACTFGIECGTPASGMNEDSSSALLEFASGAHGAYTQVFYTRRDAATRGATVSGYHGTLSFDWYRNEMRYVRHHRPFSDLTSAGEGASHFGGDIELARDFVKMVRNHRQPRVTMQDGIQSVYACLAAKESAETGRMISVRQVGQAAA